MPIRVPPNVFLLAILTGCGTSAESNAIVMRDSAGIKIIEASYSQRRPAPVTIADRASFDVGLIEGEPEYVLSRVVGAMQMSDGNTIIANGATNEIRFYDSAGKWLKSMGRAGQGPGEYEYLRALGRCRAGGFVGFDLNWQVNAYDVTGTFQDKTVLRAPDGITPYNLSCDDHGHFLILGWGHPTQGLPIGFYTTRDRLVLTSGDGKISKDFGQRLVSERIGTERGSRPHPAGRATLFALHNDVLYIGSGERFELELYNLDGALQTLIRGPAIPLNTSDSVKTAYMDWALSRVPAERQAALRNEIARWQWPESLPAFTKLLVDDDGIAWVRAFEIDPQATETWSLLDPERGYLGDVKLGADMSLLEAGRDYVLVLRRDSLDVESVLKLTLDRGRAGPRSN